jgi:hypothetical protein
MPGTISEIKVARASGLQYIKQFRLANLVSAQHQPARVQAQQIPVHLLVAYVNEQEAAGWHGHSWLRALFEHWVRKDRLLRVDAINAGRNDAGVTLAYAPPNRRQSPSTTPTSRTST